MARQPSRSRTWQTKAGRPEPVDRPVSRKQLAAELRAAERNPRLVPSKLTIKRIPRGKGASK